MSSWVQCVADLVFTSLTILLVLSVSWNMQNTIVVSFFHVTVALLWCASNAFLCGVVWCGVRPCIESFHIYIWHASREWRLKCCVHWLTYWWELVLMQCQEEMVVRDHQNWMEGRMILLQSCYILHGIRKQMWLPVLPPTACTCTTPRTDIFR